MGRVDLKGVSFLNRVANIIPDIRSILEGRIWVSNVADGVTNFSRKSEDFLGIQTNLRGADCTVSEVLLRVQGRINVVLKRDV